MEVVIFGAGTRIRNRYIALTTNSDNYLPNCLAHDRQRKMVFPPSPETESGKKCNMLHFSHKVSECFINVFCEIKWKKTAVVCCLSKPSTSPPTWNVWRLAEKNCYFNKSV